MMDAALFLMGISLTLCGVFAVMMWKDSGEEEHNKIMEYCYIVVCEPLLRCGGGMKLNGDYYSDFDSAVAYIKARPDAPISCGDQMWKSHINKYTIVPLKLAD